MAPHSDGGSSTTSGSSSDSGSSTSRAWKGVREMIEPFGLSVAMTVSDQGGFVGWPCDGEPWKLLPNQVIMRSDSD